ncbi:unnamed protein product [Urochloa decumbens]|uniref:Uncharacterized protein n=1 Tax=Urochloa decumbens TaxID=240449 RepID=A0ABC9FGE5_9POAL
MGSCLSFSRSPLAASTAEPSSPRPPAAATAKVVNMDGSMAQFAGPATALEALHALGDGRGRRHGASRSPFLCSADELGFDAPARALAPDEALRPGQLYFVLAAPMLRRPLSGDEMAALAVRAATALAAEAGLAAAGGSMSPPQRRKKQAGEAAGKGRRRQAAAQVAPLLVVSSGKDGGRSGDSWNNDTVGGGHATGRTVHDGNRTVGKTRGGASYYRSGARHRRPAVQRLSAIDEDEE